MTNQLFPPHAFAFKGGGGPSPAQQIASAPVPIPAPPVTNAAPEVMQAQQNEARANLLRKSIKSTIFAGDTGDYSSKQGVGTKTKLG